MNDFGELPFPLKYPPHEARPEASRGRHGAQASSDRGVLFRRSHQIAARPLAFIRVLTTGPDPHYHEPIEIAVARVHPQLLTVERIFSSRVQALFPERAHPNACAASSNDDGASMMPLIDVLDRVAAVAQGCVLVGHNVDFDWSFLHAAYRRSNLPLPTFDDLRIDTISLAWPLVVSGRLESVSLDVLCECLGVDPPAAASARADVARADVARIVDAYRRLTRSVMTRATTSPPPRSLTPDAPIGLARVAVL